MKPLTLMAALALAAALAGAFAWSRFGGMEGTSPARLAMGKQLYDANCAACHGIDLEGEPDWQRRRADGTLPAPPHDATGHTWHHADDLLFAITKQGTAALAPAGYKTNMMGFGDHLSDDQIRAVLDYIKSRWPEKIRAAQADITKHSRAAD